MTGFLDGLVALVVAVVLNVYISSRIKVRLPQDEAGFLQRTFWWTLVLRYLLAVVLNAFSDSSAFAGMFWGDSSQYDNGGFGLVLLWRGEPMLAPRGAGTISGYGFFYYVAAIYYVFGRNQLLVQFLNGTIGALTVVVM